MGIGVPVGGTEVCVGIGVPVGGAEVRVGVGVPADGAAVSSACVASVARVATPAVPAGLLPPQAQISDTTTISTGIRLFTFLSPYRFTFLEG